MKKDHSIVTREKESFAKLKESFGYSNVMQAPRLKKVVVSSGTGTGQKKDKNRNALVADRLSKITGQKTAPRGAKKAIATFKSREGDIIGHVATLRGPRMHRFLDKLLNVALPRTKDFKGINRSAVDAMGNLTIGIKEHSIFPETVDEDLKDVFGLAVTVVSSAKTKKEAEAFFESLGFPLKKA